jgi:hypothetical protein
LGRAIATGCEILTISGELYTAHNAVATRADVSDNEENGRNLPIIPFMMKRVHKVNVECAFDLGVENGKPVTTFLF